MNKKQRLQIILNEVHLHNRVLLTDLAGILKVSIDTVRRDVTGLDTLQKLKKVHGGAVSNGFNIYSGRNREVYELESKTIIAQKGISLLNKGDIVLISGGSTNLELIKLIPKNLNLTFFTPSLPMAIELLNNTSEYEEVIFIGGKLSRSSQLSTSDFRAIYGTSIYYPSIFVNRTWSLPSTIYLSSNINISNLFLVSISINNYWAIFMSRY